MGLSPPKTVVFVISVILAALAILSVFMSLPVIGDHRFWVLTAAYAILAIGNMFRGV